MFLYTNNEISGREIKESTLFTTATKRIKYLGIRLPKETKELHTENCKTLMKEIKEDINKWRDIPCYWGGRINILKMTILPNNRQIQCDPYQITKGSFHRTRTKTLTFIWKQKRPQVAKAVLRKKNGAGGITLTSDYTTKLQSSKQYDTGTKQKYRPMAQDRKPRNKPTYLWIPYF